MTYPITRTEFNELLHTYPITRKEFNEILAEAIPALPSHHHQGVQDYCDRQKAVAFGTAGVNGTRCPLKGYNATLYRRDPGQLAFISIFDRLSTEELYERNPTERVTSAVWKIND